MSKAETPKRRGRARGAGTVYWDDTKARWIGAVTINGRRHKVVEKHKVDAEARLSRLLTEAELGHRPANRTMTVAKAVETFMERALPERTGRGGRELTPSTLDWYRLAAELITAELGRIKLADLTEDDVEAMLDRLAKRKPKPLTAASLRKVRGVLQRVLAFAMRRRLVSHNAALEAKIPRKAAGTRPRRALSPADARVLLEALHGERNGAMFALSLRVGLRPGEAAGLYWADLDGNVLHVRRGVRVHGSKPVVVDDLKTAKSERSIELPADLVAWLDEHRREQIAERLAAREWIDSRLMFASTTGRVLSRPNVARQLTAICERVGVPATRPNELRHSCASLLSDLGVPNEHIADLLGHTTTRMVEMTYRHRLRPVVDVAVRADWANQRR